MFDELKDYPNIKSLLIIFHTENNTLILLSDGTIKCGDLVKNHAKSYNGKGGGRNDNARAKFENFSDSNSFIDKIKSVIIN